MIKGLYSAASAMLLNANRQQVLSHNIANMETPGFKQVLNTVEDFMQTEVIYSPNNLLNDRFLTDIGSLGLGAMSGPETVDFSQGGLQVTGNPYDMAIEGNAFFRVQTPEGVRYTRDGRFLRDTKGSLVTVDGYYVLNGSNQPIKLPEGQTAVATDGTIFVNGTSAAQLGLTAFKDSRAELTRDVRGNVFVGPAQSTTTLDARVAQGSLEMSNANPSSMMSEMVMVARSYEAAQKMVQNQDELLGKAIGTLGRIG